MLQKKLIVTLIAVFVSGILISCSAPFNGNMNVQEEPTLSLLLSEAERFLYEGEYQEAILQYEAAIEIEPLDPDAYIGLANTYLSQNNSQAALNLLLLALENGVEDPGAVADAFLQALSAAGGYAMQADEDYYCVLPDNSDVYRLSSSGDFLPLGDEYAFSMDPRYGNTPGNITIGGFGAQRDGWVYLSTYNTANLYKMRPDGGEPTELFPGSCSFINVQGEWVYFCDDENGGKLCRMRTDGTQLEVLNPDKTIYAAVYGDWIYYISVPSADAVYGFAFENFGSIYRSRTDGSERACLLEGKVSSMSLLNGEWLYYCDREEDYGIGRIRTDGSEKQIISHQPALCIQATENSIYWSNRITEGELAELMMCDYSDAVYSMNYDGSNAADVFVEGYPFSAAILYEGDVFPDRFSSESEALYVSRSGSPEHSMFNRDACQLGFSLLDGWIYYYTFEPMIYDEEWDYSMPVEDAGFYRMLSNGEGRQLIHKLDWREE